MQEAQEIIFMLSVRRWKDLASWNAIDIEGRSLHGNNKEDSNQGNNR